MDVEKGADDQTSEASVSEETALAEEHQEEGAKGAFLLDDADYKAIVALVRHEIALLDEQQEKDAKDARLLGLLGQFCRSEGRDGLAIGVDNRQSKKHLASLAEEPRGFWTEVLKALKICVVCHGTGKAKTHDPNEWRPCKTCGGDGRNHEEAAVGQATTAEAEATGDETAAAGKLTISDYGGHC